MDEWNVDGWERGTVTHDGEKHDYIKTDKIEIYFANDFEVVWDENNYSLNIFHFSENYFRIITSDNTLIDCVTHIHIANSNDKDKIRIVFEIGMDCMTSGFCTKIIDKTERFTIFLEKYTSSQKEGFEVFIQYS